MHRVYRSSADGTDAERYTFAAQAHCVDPNPITRPIEVRSAIFLKGANVMRLLNAAQRDDRTERERIDIFRDALSGGEGYTLLTRSFPALAVGQTI